MRQTLLLIIILGINAPAFAQTFNLTGRITNAAREPVALVSVQVKEWQSGTLSKDDGRYSLKLEKGKYDIVFSIIGYKSQLITITVTKNTVQDIILEADMSELQNFTLRTKYKDPAVEIIKNVIRHKDSLQESAGNWSSKIYIKAVQQDSLAAQKKSKSKSKKDTISLANRDLAGMAMAEISMRLDYSSESKIKEERLGVKRFGNIEDLFYLSATEGFFNFYNNLIRVPGLSTASFLGPVSFSGLLGYKYKTLKSEKKGNYKLWTISVKPRQMSNSTVEGELVISDSNWTITHARFSFPKFHLPQYEFFETEQWFDSTGKSALISKQEFNYYSKNGKGKMSGTTVVTYGDYELNKQFPKNYFGVEVSATTEEAYKRDSSFWETARTEPLTSKEIKFIQFKDSIYRVTHTKQYLDSIDHLTNKFTWKKLLLTGQTLYNRELERTWVLPSIPSVYQPISFGGMRLTPSVGYFKTYKSRKNIRMFANMSYGFRNKDFNGGVSLNRMYNPFNRGFYGISLRRDFEFLVQGDAWINQLKRNNQYLNQSFGIYHGLELYNGLFFYSDLDVAFRRSLSDYKVGTTIDDFGGEFGQGNQAEYFQSYNGVYGKVRFEYTPFQRYIREPKEKIILGSKWPTFYTGYRKGFRGVLNGQADFDFWDIGIKQEINAGLFGSSRYNFSSGTFLNKRNVQRVDQQYQRRSDPFLFQNPDYTFQAIDTSFALFKRYYQLHGVHEFNGYFLNKIPLLKKLQLREVVGAGFLYAPEINLRYFETFAGVERVFTWPFNAGSKFKVGVYMVSSVANKYNIPLQLKLGVTSWDKRRNRWF